MFKKVSTLEACVVKALLTKFMLQMDCKDAGCAVLAVGESADFAVLDKNILKDPTASVEAVYLKGRDTSKSRFPFFHI